MQYELKGKFVTGKHAKKAGRRPGRRPPHGSAMGEDEEAYRVATQLVEVLKGLRGVPPRYPGGPPRHQEVFDLVQQHFRGRPPRHQGERLRKNRTFRVRDVLDENLVAAAATSGRSVSEEIEYRLAQSFDRDALIGLVLGGDENAAVLHAIATAMKMMSHDSHWLSKVSSAEAVRLITNSIIEQFAGLQPSPTPSVAKTGSTEVLAPIASIAQAMMEMSKLSDSIRRLKPLLGRPLPSTWVPASEGETE